MREQGECHHLIQWNVGYLGFFQFLRNFHQLTAFEQAELILYAALDPVIASKQGQKGRFCQVFGPLCPATKPDKLSDLDC